MTTKLHRADKERIIAALRRKPVDRVPLHENIFNRRFIRHFLGADFETSLEMDPKLHILMAERLGMDLVTIGEYWRAKILTKEELENLQPPDISVFLKRVDDYLAVTKGTSVGLNVYVHGPFDQTYLSMNYERFFTGLYDDISLVEAIMDMYLQRSLSLVQKLIKQGADTIEIVDDICYGKGLMVQPAIMEKMWLPRIRLLMEPILDSRIPCFFHSDGEVSSFINYVIGLGFEGLNPIEPLYNDIAGIKEEYGRKITIMGNMDIGGVLANGSEKEVRQKMRELLKTMMPNGGYIAMSSSSIIDAVVPENYIAMVETVREYGQY